MSINSNCLNKLKSLGLPMIVDLKDKKGLTLGQAKINADGTVLYNKITYSSPSQLRHAKVAKFTGTYKYLVYSTMNNNPTYYGKALHDLGVTP